MERAGEALVSFLVLVFSDFDPDFSSAWVAFFIAACPFMAFYEIFWIRYFKSQKTMRDFYGPVLGIPVAGASLPVLSFFLLGIYAKNVLFLLAVALLGIGHIGIHLGHLREIE